MHHNPWLFAVCVVIWIGIFFLVRSQNRYYSRPPKSLSDALRDLPEEWQLLSYHHESDHWDAEMMFRGRRMTVVPSLVELL
jgi:hypothetical protein